MKSTQSAQLLNRQVTQTVSLQYLLHLPVGYSKSKKKRWPLMLFLHGAGERGDDLNLVKSHGPPKLIEQGKDFPFIVVSPQCRGGVFWRTEPLDVLLDEITAKYRVDETRVYCTGISMGGYGTWAMAERFPQRFAAIVPICGGGAWFWSWRIGQLPTWVFHGAKDDVVVLERSEEMVNALRQMKNKVKFTVYPDAGHDSWTATYENPQLYRWLLKHQQKNPRK